MKNLISTLARIFLALVLFDVPVFAQSLPQIELKQVFPKLQIERPVWMSEAPDGSGRFFAVGQAGKILVVKKDSDGADAKEFLNIEDRHPYFQNEDGLLSIAFHPGFKTNGLFYIYYTLENPKDQNLKPQNYPYHSVVSEFKVSATDPDKADMSSERILLQVPEPFWNHKGGELCFGPDGYLYLGLGDGGLGGDPFGSGQSTSTLLAKMLRIDVNTRDTIHHGNREEELPYGIPRDNPFAHEPNARHEIFAYGLRNPWRYSFDRATGDLWVGDVGQDLWEEVDLVTKGGDYGWSVREGAHHYKPGPEGAQYIDPVIEYPHRADMQSQAMFPDHSPGLCVIGGYVYRGKKYPALDGVYIYGDNSLGTIWGLRYDRDAHKVTEHGKLLQQPQNVNSFAEDEDGEIYAIMMSGKIYSITAP
ncbi:MAG TPA: PQQ-dependent sugar dehydrogenase [Verrucomicrobiae bacterium]|nr:PQQ-dependent sugar dehydrogenase [Verrucomicrobiae bacterium]